MAGHWAAAEQAERFMQFRHISLLDSLCDEPVANTSPQGCLASVRPSRSGTNDSTHFTMQDNCARPHPTSMGVLIFFSLIFSYFCFFVAALSPCQGKLPRRKYIST